jgi:hypothetical protein
MKKSRREQSFLRGPDVFALVFCISSSLLCIFNPPASAPAREAPAAVPGLRRNGAAVFMTDAASPLQRQAAPSENIRSSLDALRAKAAEYCRRLENSAFDFVCREEIVETIDPSLDASLKTPPPDPVWIPYKGPTITVSRVKKIKHTYVYDYQCVRAGRTIREIRNQLQENGKRKIVPNAELETTIIVFGRALLGPVGFFGERFQPDYEFTLAGEDKIGKTKVLVIDARPKPGTPPSRNLFGKAWLDPATADILRIEWSESRVGHFDIFEARGRLFDRKPRLVIRSEFKAEKNGIRFPSRLFIEEAYLNKAGKAAVRSKTEVVYKDFKFFTVEVEVH